MENNFVGMCADLTFLVIRKNNIRSINNTMFVNV
jgi:hypothetical protein